MDPVRFFSSSKTLIVAGKGGVGKTVLSTILATASARLGLSTLLVEVGGRSSVELVLGVEAIGYEPVEVSSAADDRGALHARSITPDDALVEWLSLHGFRRLVERGAEGPSGRREARRGRQRPVAVRSPSRSPPAGRRYPPPSPGYLHPASDSYAVRSRSGARDPPRPPAHRALADGEHPSRAGGHRCLDLTGSTAGPRNDGP